MEMRRDKVSKFQKVTNTITGEQYLVHVDDLPKLGTNIKLCLYEIAPAGYKPPDKEAPHGKYFHRPRFFVGTYLVRPA